MSPRSVICLILSWVTFMLFLALIASSNSKLFLNNKVMTYIDISSQLVIVTNNITIENINNQPIEKYLFIVDPIWMHNLSYIEAADKRERSLSVNKIYTDDTWLKYDIIFQNPLLPGETETIQISSVFINYLQSYPKNVNQHEKHLVLFSFNVYYYSAYFTEDQTTYLFLRPNNIISVDGAKYKMSNDTNYGLQYGPYLDVPPMSETISIIHYENMSPFLTVDKLDRYIRISHWGYLIVWEHILLFHTGPKLKGTYERPTMRNPPPDTRIESFVTTLPGNAFDVYLRDEIGLISSFHVDYNDPRKVDVIIKPRHVLYGGWKTIYEIGYTLPIQDYLFHNNNGMFSLSMPIFDRVFPNMIIKEAKINIILPEDAVFKDLDPYFALENSTNFCYFLDFFCREVVSFRRHNLIDNHRSDLMLTYSYQQSNLLFKPLLISLLLHGIFFTYLLARLTKTRAIMKTRTKQPQPIKQTSIIKENEEEKHKNQGKVKTSRKR